MMWMLYHVGKNVPGCPAAISEKQPHLVLIDSEIGFQDARIIHELLTSQFPGVKIIVLSDAAHWQRWKTISASHQVLLKGFSTRRLKGDPFESIGGFTRVGVRPPT